ncbi:secreted RxLR effector protein 78-like [Typha latifolia]|uniref:secreted RxLR effector protein 78-like n=1 Tax=Typha latifolia TaxID=4733 RepID=UPI003C2FBF04
MTVNDDRPIGLCNTLYKIISKLLAARMKSFIPDLILEAQKAFVPRRQILDNQVDLLMAFDRMDWKFFMDCLKLYGFPNMYTKLIHRCIFSSSLVVEVNGNASGFFKLTWGLRQECPLSPYLFILGTNILSYFIKMAATDGLLKGIKIAHSAPPHSHLLFRE